MLAPGSTLHRGRYRIDSHLGGGGFGVVYLATDITLGRPVAIKMLRPEMAARGAHAVEAFLTEARLTAGLPSHPHIVAIHDVDEEELAGQRLPYIVMEYLEGGDLE